MKVKIEECRNENQVLFSSEFGSANGNWCVGIPKSGNEYNVEVDLEGLVVFKENLTFSDLKECKIQMKGNKICLIGLLESVEEDGYAVLRLNDYIIPFEISGELPEEGQFVEIEINEIDLYPFE